MIKQETITINNKEFKRTYSDSNLKIKKIGTNEVYTDAVDLLDSNYQYEETNEIIESESEQNV